MHRKASLPMIIIISTRVLVLWHLLQFFSLNKCDLLITIGNYAAFVYLLNLKPTLHNLASANKCCVLCKMDNFEIKVMYIESCAVTVVVASKTELCSYQLLYFLFEHME